jgi:hypothetical protein
MFSEVLVQVNGWSRSLPSHMPPNRSPHQSTHVVMPPHYIGLYALVEGKRHCNIRSFSHTRKMWEAQNE